MLTPQLILPMAGELLVDLFCGGGGASTGIEMALGRYVDVAVNHDPQAVSLHEANHPQTRHYRSDVFEVDPLEVTQGMPVGLLWASPDCKHFSKAKGGKPVSKKIRSLANVVIEWAAAVAPRVIMLENVEEFQDWGPLLDSGRPCPERKGHDFQRWVGELRAHGYRVEWRELRACDFGAPTIRKRLFLIARRDHLPIVWPEPTHGPGRKPYRTAAECIDWTIPCRSIFLTTEEGRALGIKRPLADNTLRRIAHGIKRYVLDAAKPYVVRIGHTGHGDGGKTRSIEEPLSTVTAKNEHLLCIPTIAPLRGTSSAHKNSHAVTSPLSTVTAGGMHHALVATYLAKHFGGEPANGKTCASLERPLPTVTGRDHSAVVTATLAAMSNDGQDQAVDRRDQVHALLIKYYGSDQDPRLDEPLHTITTKPRFGLVTVRGERYSIADIGMRMFRPRELYRAQGFPESYRIDKGADGKPLSQEAQIRMCGNSVSPPMAAALVRANYSDLQALSAAA